ncbi:MAG TPA: hypothetical protein VEO54_18045 [Thermoanaerobaculia bacterium]|nr:hypothetical protein [Thermoanaerobaculia bacterium]
MSASITLPDEIALPENVESLAVAVVEKVGVADVIAQMADQIFAKIEACEAFSSGSQNADAFFFATSLPVANAVIHRTTPDRLTRALRWSSERWPAEDDPAVPLATWTLIYIISEGWKRYSKIAEKKVLWDRILAHVAALAEEPSPATAAQHVVTAPAPPR